MDTSSSSKVTVEYHDPSGIFPLISKEIAARLPLRDLIWRSPTRPLRKINSLHLELVPDSYTKNSLRPPIARTDSNGTTSFDILRSGIEPRKNAVKERRHQIPGLQTSPYMKLYILRADDKDPYKATERKKIREWVRDNAAASSKGKGENHDAFEWMIIHVVIPDTIASTEPRWRESSRDSEELKERKQDPVDEGTNNRRSIAYTGHGNDDRRNPDEREKAWEHLMGKIKTMILTPFDTRVRQYEADVAEQDARRALPGFNFCTFFIYKEGLAMAFESIGLVEDALVIYDELSLGFETVLKSIAGGRSDGSATSFAPYTADIIDRIVRPSPPTTNGTPTEEASDSVNTSAFQKDYREKIVRSDISVFDFSCYLFARQNALILRIANAKSSRSGSSASQKDESEDLVLISEVCWRAASFIHNAARSLRQDLNSYRAWQWEKQVETPISDPDIESLVSSWTYVVAGQMLHETHSPALETVNEPGRRDLMQNETTNGLKHPAVASLGGVSAHPHRTSSLPSRKTRTSEVQGRDSLQSASDSDLMSPPVSSGFEASRNPGGTPGLIELVTYRGELLMMQRKMLEHVAKQQGWVSGWALMKETKHAKMEDIELNGDIDGSRELKEMVWKTKQSELVAPALAQALKSRETFCALYERLSNQAMRLYLAATQSKRAESILGDLAILKYQQGDFNYAASYFQHVLPFYTEEAWSLMEIEALRMHAMCLKELDRKEEYVVTLLALVAKACGWRSAQSVTAERAPTFDEVADVAGVLPEALSFSKHLDDEVSNPAALYFSDINLDREVVHFGDRDGISLRLRLRHLLDDDVQLDSVAARLVSADDPQVEVWLSATNVQLERGINDIKLESSTTSFGSFQLHGIALQTNKVVFVHEPSPETGSQETMLFLYPNQHAFEAEMTLTRHVQIDKIRHLDVRLASGRNTCPSMDLKFRPASAGLRLHLADAAFDGIQARCDNNQQGQLSLCSLEPNSDALIRVPYTLEQPGQDIFVRLELSYTTSDGTFTFLTSAQLQTRLPLDVDVDDLFRIDKLISNFTLRAAKHTQVSITEATLGSSAAYDVEAPPSLPMPVYASEREPARLSYKITKNKAEACRGDKKDAVLMLDLSYHLLEDLVLQTLRQYLAGSLEAGALTKFSRLLLPFFYERCKRLNSSTDIKQAAISNKAIVPSFEATGWSEIIAGLPELVRNEVADWLDDWHKQNTSITIEPGSAPQDVQRTVTIPVEVPSIDFVHSASLDIKQEETRFSKGNRILTQGEPLQALLQITTTTDWNTKAVRAGPTHFFYDIQADPECWLIGGLKRGHFTAASNSKLTVEVLLIPVKTGLHHLPHVEVHVAEADKGADGEEANKPEPSVSCESHYDSAGQVQIVGVSQTTRVWIPEPTADGPGSRPGSSRAAKDAGG